jgi:hypothetical protein
VVEPTARPPLQHAQTVGIPHQPQQRRKLTAGVISLSGEANASRERNAGVSELGRGHAVPQRGVCAVRRARCRWQGCCLRAYAMNTDITSCREQNEQCGGPAPAGFRNNHLASGPWRCAGVEGFRGWGS